MQTSSLGRHRCDAVPHKDLHDIPNLCPISWMAHAHCAASPAADSARPSRVNAPPERHRKGHLLHVHSSLGLVGDQRAHAQRGALRAVPVNVRERRAGHRKRSGCVPGRCRSGSPASGLARVQVLERLPGGIGLFVVRRELKEALEVGSCLLGRPLADADQA